jgi:hypothetical protein
MTQIKTTGIVMIEDVRIAFAHGLWTASVVQGSTGKAAFSASFLLKPGHKSIAVVQKAMLEVANAKWGAQGAEVLKGLVAGGRVCLRDGNSKPEIEGYPGNLFVSARSPTRPLVVDQNRQPLSQEGGKPYSGSYVNARLSIWAQQNSHGRRINAQLTGVQFVRDGEPFSGGGSASAEDFGEVADSAKAGSEFGDIFGT